MKFEVVALLSLLAISCSALYCRDREVIPSSYLYAESQNIYSEVAGGSSNPNENLGACSYYLLDSCCTVEYLEHIQKKHDTAKATLQEKFEKTMEFYKDIYKWTVEQSKERDITKIFKDAFNYSYIHPASQFIDAIHVFFIKDIVTELRKTIEQAESGFSNCSEVLLTHLAGLSCLFCDAKFLDQGVFDNKTLNIDLSVCYQFMSNCQPYMKTRAYLANLANILQTTKVLTENYKVLEDFKKDPIDFYKRIAFSSLLKNLKRDYFEYPLKCVDEYDCHFACEGLINGVDINVEKIVNPTSRSTYTTEFALLTSDPEFKPSSQAVSYIETDKNVNYNTEGFDTISLGATKYTGLKSIVTFKSINDGRKLVFSFVLSIAIIFIFFI